MQHKLTICPLSPVLARVVVLIVPNTQNKVPFLPEFICDNENRIFKIRTRLLPAEGPSCFLLLILFLLWHRLKRNLYARYINKFRSYSFFLVRFPCVCLYSAVPRAESTHVIIDRCMMYADTISASRPRKWEGRHVTTICTLSFSSLVAFGLFSVGLELLILLFSTATGSAPLSSPAPFCAW